MQPNKRQLKSFMKHIPGCQAVAKVKVVKTPASDYDLLDFTEVKMVQTERPNLSLK